MAGVKRYPVYWADITDIWVRYRVVKCKVRATFYPTGATSSLAGGLYPYRSTTSGIVGLDGVICQTDSVTKPLNYSTGAPVIVERTFDLRDCYKLIDDSTENGLEGPMVWAAATH